MELSHILIFCGIAAAIGLTPQRWRHWLILAVSIVAIYWMQPITPIRHLDFWLPTLTLALSVIVWAAVESAHMPKITWGSAAPALGVMTVLILSVAATRYTGDFALTASVPPQITSVLIALVVIAAITLAPTYLPTSSTAIKLTTLIVLLIVVLVILKAPPLAQLASIGLRSLTAQSTASARASDIGWLGISYVAFRLLHVLFDRLNGAATLPSLPLHKFLGYVLFFPTYTAGPIDRAERYLKDADKEFSLNWAALYTGGSRIVLGLFKKFVLADLLSIIALDTARAAQVDGAGWTWILLYAYAWRIFFDFSGLSDVAIGLGHLMGFNIPENFNKPYTQGNLTQFWNNWHMTLSQWFRSYWFNPLNRWFRSSKIKFSQAAMIAISQITTMILIAMWHQITVNFLIWALWHGIGLFVHNRWVNATRLHWRKLEETRPRLRKVLGVLGVMLTFHYVALGWVWFALETPALALETFKNLFGF